MGCYIKIENGVIVQKQPNAEPGFVETEQEVTCGMIDNGDGTFSNPVKDTAVILEEERAGMIVSRFQARAALHNAGLLADVEAAMQDPATDPIVVIAWKDATTFNRLSPAVQDIGLALGMTDDALDELFRAAALIEV